MSTNRQGVPATGKDNAGLRVIKNLCDGAVSGYGGENAEIIVLSLLNNDPSLG